MNTSGGGTLRHYVDGRVDKAQSLDSLKRVCEDKSLCVHLGMVMVEMLQGRRQGDTNDASDPPQSDDKQETVSEIVNY